MVLKSSKVLIGEKEFTIKELTCAKRDVLFDIIGSHSLPSILKAIVPLLGELERKDKDTQKPEQKIYSIFNLALVDTKVFSTLIACFLRTIRVGIDAIVLSVQGCTVEDESYIRNNITISQEPSILNTIIEINSLPETIKNYLSLLKAIKTLKAI